MDNSLPLWAKGLLVLLGTVIVGGGLVWCGTCTEGTPSIFLLTIGALVLTGGFFSWLGAVIARLEVARFMEKQYGLTQQLQESGIMGVTYFKTFQIPDSAVKIDMLVIRAHHWLGIRAVELKHNLKNADAVVRICIFKPSGGALDAIINKFGEKAEDINKKIYESIKNLVSTAEEAKTESAEGRLEIYAHNLIPHHTYYKFDEHYYVVWYPMRRGKIDELPMLKLGKGTVQNFFQDDFEKLLREDDTCIVYKSDEDNESNTGHLIALGLSSETVASLLQ